MPTFTKADAHWMSMALKLARNGRFSTTPNPNVGCVIIDARGNLLGQGYHQKAGQGHAEVNALIDAGFTPYQNIAPRPSERHVKPVTFGATAYVTLEPCSHTGKTPPCAKALIEAQIGRVVIASIDRNPEVRHKGIALLQDAGIKVDVGLMDAEAQKLNTAFNFRMAHNLPWVIIKLATSLDGKTALQNGESKWITGPKSRANVQIERALSCAILSGADTVIADNPRLNVRVDELPEFEFSLFQKRVSQPLRVVIDGQNRLHNNYQIFKDEHQVMVFNAQQNPLLTAKNIEQVQVPLAGLILNESSQPRQYLDLQAIMRTLAKKQINRVWTETGAALSGALLNANLVNELIVYQAPMLLGSDARGAVNIGQLTSLQQVIKTEFEEVTQVGNDLKIRLSIKI
jgi:diaminohydroxyphosphoribosylaminopyrimidine deaminase/5-amino-6-(5-phosphoribosylamino)uracil reductase